MNKKAKVAKHLDLRPEEATRSGSGILSTIGQTPIVQCDRLYPEKGVQLYAKLEFVNPGGSAKDRPSRKIIETALSTGDISAKTTVIESSSGNMGIGLAQICRYYGIPFICVVDPKTTKQHIALLKAYGAAIEVIEEPDPETGEYLDARIERVRELVSQIPCAFWPNQYHNALNAASHHDTAFEILHSVGACDWVVMATSTCGTLRGCAEYFRSYAPKTKIIAVDAVGSIIFGGAIRRRLLPGHGASIIPPLYSKDLANLQVIVSDYECVIGCRRLVNREAILAGASSGAVVAALSKVPRGLIEGTRCVLILHDRGERYLDSVYSDDWVLRNLGRAPSGCHDTVEV